VTRAILHVDMDAFYASVETLDDPSLAGCPVIVGGTSGRGVVAAANYEVRKFGVHSAMPMGEALRRCPHAVCIRPRMSRYQDVSRRVFEIFHEYTPVVEGLSLDEAFLDITASLRLLGPAEGVALRVKQDIRRHTGLTASVGLSENKLLAKIASDLNKPDGFCRIGADNLRAVVDPLPIQRLFGVGPKTLARVQAAGIRSFGDLRQASDETVWRLFGKEGATMRARAAGIDDRPVIAERDEKSISAEETFAQDIRSQPQLLAHVTQLADRTGARLRAAHLMAGVVTLKVRRSDFGTFTRQQRIEPATHDTATLLAVAKGLLQNWRAEYPDWSVRLLGVGVSDLNPATQGDLFAGETAKNSRQDAAVDQIRQRFGAKGIVRGGLLPAPGTDTKARRGRA
jgi:DNA polymerase-4